MQVDLIKATLDQYTTSNYYPLYTTVHSSNWKRSTSDSQEIVKMLVTDYTTSHFRT